jgi:zinc transport system substrate-binding protein
MLFITSCSTTNNNKNTVNNKKISIVTTFYAEKDIVSQIVDTSFVDVIDLSAGSLEPHTIELTNKQVNEIKNSDLFIYIPNAQVAVDNAYNETTPKNTIQWNHLGHPWLDPILMIELTEQVTNKLVELDTEHTSLYTQNKNKLTKELTGLYNNYSNALKNCQSKYIVTTHNAFTDLANRFNLKQLSITGADPESEPSLKVIKDIKQEILKHNIGVIYYESSADKKIVEGLANEMKLKLRELNPIENSNNDYFSVMQSNLEVLKTQCQK